jgi:putative ABC transport system permease protein
MRRRERMLEDLDEEIRNHIEMETQDNIERGMPPVEARYAALRKFGNVTGIKEEAWEIWGFVWVEHLFADIRFGLRMLRKNPAFTAVAVLTLALGIGANTAVFSVVNAVLLRPVSAPEPDRVVVFMSTNRGGSSSLSSEIKFNVWREQNGVLQDVSAYRPGFSSLNLTGVDQPQRADGIFVTQNYFHLFGLPLAQGRSFTADEEQSNSRKVVILSDAFWKRALGGDPQILSKTISLNGHTYQVIGILAAGIRMENLGTANAHFSPESMPDVWLPFPIDPNSSNQNHYFQAVGRLKPGVTLAMANAQLQLATQEFRRKFPSGISTSRGDVFSVQLLRNLLVKDVRSSLLILMGAVSFVLLIACANVASLFLARATSRMHEIAIRAAVGASRGRIVRQLLAESMLLSVLGAALGLGLGFSGIHALLSVNPYNIPRIGVNDVECCR